MTKTKQKDAVKMKCSCCGDDVANNRFFLHSECCGAHWELTGNGHEIWIECEMCGKRGPDLAQIVEENKKGEKKNG